MKDIDQQIALSGWAGWKIVEDSRGWNYGVYSPTGKNLRNANLKEELVSELPDTNSLDVLHEFEMKLTRKQQIEYLQALSLSTGAAVHSDPFGYETKMIFADAAQRRMALLKALNLWREDSKVK